MAEDEIVEAVVADEYKSDEETKGKLTALAIVAILVIASLSAYILLYRDDEEEQTPEPLKAKIFVLSDTVGMGEEVTFDGSNSTGEIISYKWDFNYNQDTSGDGNPRNDVDATGVTVRHTYNEPGDYRVSLTVDNDTGTSKDTMFIHVGYFGEFYGAVGPTDSTETFYFTLSQTMGIKNFSAVLTYASGSLDRNDITLYIYDSNGTLVNDTEHDTRESGAEQTEYIYLDDLQIFGGWWPGDFRAEVRWIAPLTASAISFDLTIDVYY